MLVKKRIQGWETVSGKEDWEGAAFVAESCPGFHMDVEEELIADELVSCYNCRYRRWTADAFDCLKRT